ncbi:MAG: hypothetical protein QMD80_00190 [archaeon]|nr:hypothetical protein [archaeon]
MPKKTDIEILRELRDALKGYKKMKSKGAFFAIFISISALLILINTASAAINITDADAIYEANLSGVSVPTSPIPIKTVFVVNADASLDQNLSSVSVSTQPSLLKEIFIINEDAKCFEELIIPKELISEKVFDTRAPTNPYPSIFGTHNGTIMPSHDVTVNKMYTYSCPGTGGHSEFVMIWNDTIGECAVAEWDGYIGDYHNISFNKTLTLEKGVIYNYTIKTGSYPQIHHTNNLSTPAGFHNLLGVHRRQRKEIQ